MARTFQPSFYRWAINLPESGPVVLLHQLGREIFAELGGEAVQRHIGFYETILARWQGEGERKPGDREALRCMGAIERGHVKLAALREQAWLQARAEVFQQLGERIPLPHSPESADVEATAEEKAMVRQLSQKLRQVSAFTEGIEFGRGFELGSGPGSGSFSGGSMPKKVPDPLDSAGDGKGSGTFSAHTAAQKMSQTLPREMEPDPSTQKMSQTLASEPDPVEPPTNKQIKTGVRKLISLRADRGAVKALEAEARSGRMSRVEFVRRIETMMGARQSA